MLHAIPKKLNFCAQGFASASSCVNKFSMVQSWFVRKLTFDLSDLSCKKCIEPYGGVKNMVVSAILEKPYL